MSRICGAVDLSRKGRPVAETMRRLAKPMIHHEKFVLDESVVESSAFGRVHFGSGPSFSSSSINLIPGCICVCAGYITDLSDWAERILSDSQGQISIKSPADILSYLVARKQGKGLDDINGIFAFALWEVPSRTLHLGTDRYGLKPLYYMNKGGQIEFASEIKAISYNHNDLGLNYGALEDLASVSFVVGDKTQFADIDRVPAATVLTFREGKVSQNRYWWFDRLKIDPKLTLPEFINENQQAFKRAMSRVVSLCDRTMCTLSSGNDSRRIFLELVKCGKPVGAYTAAVQLKGSIWESDLVVASALCREFNVPHTTVGIHDSKDEPLLADLTLAVLDHETTQHRWALPLLSEIPVNAGVNFDGIGGDSVVYDTSILPDKLARNIGNLELARHLVQFNMGVTERAYFRPISGSSVVERIKERLDQLPHDDNRNTHWFLSEWLRRRTAPFAQSLLSMKVESVLPYYDNEFVEYSMKLSPDLKMGRILQQDILSAHYPELMKRIPTGGSPGTKPGPDSLGAQYVNRIPDDYQEKKTSTYLIAVSRQIVSTPKMFSLMSLRSTISAVTIYSLGLIGLLNSKTVGRAWRLIPLGLTTRILKSANNPDFAWKELNRARAFIYKK